MSKPRLVVLVSGSGSSLQALLDACDTDQLNAEIVAVFSNKKKAFGLERAKRAKVPNIHVPYAPFADQGRAAYDAALAKQVVDFAPDLIVLAGWMRILTRAFLDQFPSRIINLHPALPETYIGANGIEWAFNSFQNGDIKHGGCMVHYVIPAVDEGQPIDTEIVPIFPHDTQDDYAQRLHAADHILIVRATQKALKALSAN